MNIFGVPIPVNNLKLIVFAIILFLGYLWTSGSLKKYANQAKKLGHRYGFITLLLLIGWWILFPTGTIEDSFIMVIVGYIGWPLYFIGIGLLSLYLLWRLQVTILIYD